MEEYDALLIDAGTGNLRSVHKALQVLGARVKITANPGDLERASRVILPGVGAFGRFMGGLRERGLDEALRAAARRGTPLLGICVGMQALFARGEELGEFAGLGLLSGRVARFPAFDNLKIPHTGWNQIEPVTESPLLAGLDGGDYAYFNHSYYCEPADPRDAAGRTSYGMDFCSVVQRGNLYGVQFHPEKSQRVGQRLLSNFIRGCSG